VPYRRCYGLRVGDGIDDATRIGFRLRAVVGLDGGQISDEELVSSAELVGQGFDE
jgi:hypothetical protein